MHIQSAFILTFDSEIGVLFSMPRTASVIASSKSLLMALTLDDLQEVLPVFPTIERAIREEAQERLGLLMKHKRPPISITSTSMRERLLAVPLFRHLPQDILHFLGLKMTPAMFAPFTPILVQDTPGREIFFIISGSVEVIDAPSAKIRARLGPGQFFGELAWLSLSPLRTASVRSVTQVDTLVLEDSVLQEVSKVYPAMRRSIEQVANERMTRVDFIMSPRDMEPYSSLVSQPIGSGTLVTVADQDPFSDSKSKRKLSIPTRASPRNSTQMASAVSLQAAAPANKKARKRSATAQDVVKARPFAGRLEKAIVVRIMSLLKITEQARLRLVHSTWNELALNMPLHTLSLLEISRSVDDQTLHQVAIFARSRPMVIDISNCSHLTDSAFSMLVAYCAASAVSVSLASCWNISPPVLIDLAVKAPNLRALNLSNCRKMNDQALFSLLNAAYKLEELDLGYCKHISDRSMHCIAVHASTRLKVLKLARCTAITDAGFGYWSYAPTGFPRMTTLVLRDCTFLSDNSIVALVNACSALEDLDLGFCCALSDTSVEVLSLGLPSLRKLLLSFCGSAVSDSSLRSVSHHLQSLRELSVRGCVRVTDVGVAFVLNGIKTLRRFDVTQCRNVRSPVHRTSVDIRVGG